MTSVSQDFRSGLQTSPPMLKQYRLLLPWFERETAIRLVLAGQPRTPERLAAAAEQWQAAANVLQSRKPWVADATALPLPPELEGRARDFLATTNLDAMPDFAGATIRVVELGTLLSYQAKISTDDASGSLLAGFDGTLESTFPICLPTAARMDPVQVFTEGTAARIESDNPNLRFGGFQLAGSMLVANFGFRPPWVQVCKYRGRFFVRNGYHRCWALLHAGATHAVAVVLPVNTLAELGAAEPGFIGEAHLLGATPPMLRDFEDPRLYATIVEPASRRVIRLSGTEATERPE